MLEPGVLEDPVSTPTARCAPRLDLTAEITVGAQNRVQACGATRLERVISLVHLGDLVSIYLAVLRGVDPGPVDILGELKSALASR